MAWWNFGLWGKKRDSDYEAQALQSEWVPPTEAALQPPVPEGAMLASDDAAVFLERVYSNQDC